MNLPINKLIVALIALLITSTVSTAMAQRGGGRGMNRLPGDVELEKAPVPVDDFERNALVVLKDIEANERFRNVPQHDGRLLRIMAHAIGAKHIVELGTSTGVSGIWLGSTGRPLRAALPPYGIGLAD